ncbi:ACT domain-containing protein [uncultured Shewanella sp.]|uniref:ACT domain-containing protein n=1 Tax=uncultured Shewanella sp. TaxID=173975 RepID=UPI00261D9605|nr:ACT domain-containing protein [uncultured Shewanella sp.]
MPKMTLAIHEETFCIHSLDPNKSIPEKVFAQDIYFIGKTKDEISIVTPECLSINSQDSEPDWRCLEVIGPLGFSMTGLLSKVSGILAKEEISILAISTFETDYILVKSHDFKHTLSSLKKTTITLLMHKPSLIMKKTPYSQHLNNPVMNH